MPLNLPLQPHKQDQLIYDQPCNNQAFCERRPPTPPQKVAHDTTPPERPDSPLERLQTSPGLMRLQEQSKILMPHWYKPQFSQSDVVSYLHDKDPGWFIIHDSTSVAGVYILTVRIPPEQIKIPQRKSKKGRWL